MSATPLKKVRQGSALVTVLMVIALATLVSTTLIGSAFFNLNISLNIDNVAVARNLADSVVAVAAQQLMANYPQTAPTSLPADVVMEGPTTGLIMASPGYTVPDSSNPNGQLERPDFSEGKVTFSTAEGLPYSLNNLGPDTVSRSGYNGQPVPANSMHLIGIGFYKGVTAYTDAIIWVPAYPYAIAASGLVTLNGSVNVGAVATSSLATACGALIPEKCLQPAALGDISTSSPAICMSPGAGNSVYVAGDVDSVGSVSENGTVIINGQLIQNAAPFPVPSVTVTSYDPAGQAGVQTLAPCAAASNLALTGYNVVTPGATYTATDINLNGAVLYVKGSLDAQSISGNGAIIAEGNVTINQSANLTSNDSLALLANGNVTLNGSDGASQSTFKGLVYTQGNLSANNLTIMGEYVANGGTTSVGGNVQLTNSNVILAPDKSTLTNWPSATASAGATVVPDGPSFNDCIACICGLGRAGAHVTGHIEYCNGYKVVLCAPVQGCHPATQIVGCICNKCPTKLKCGLTAAFRQVYKNYGYPCKTVNKMVKCACSSLNNTLVELQNTVCGKCCLKASATTSGGSTPTPAALMTPNPFSFNNFLTNPTQNARVLMWQPYIP